MKIIIVENGLVILLLEIENTDSLLLDVPLSFINRIRALRAVNHFYIAATI